MKFERLGNIVTISKGKKPFLVDSPDEHSVRVLQIDDLRNDNNLKYTNEADGVLAFEDDILLAWDGANAGTVGFGKKGFIGSTIALLRKKSPKQFDTIFIGKFLQGQSDFLRSKCTGATIPHIDRKFLEGLRIPVIPISEQIQISEILSKAEILIAQRKESLLLLDEFLKSSFAEMFGNPVKNEKGWRLHKLKDYAKIRIGPFGSLLHEEDYVSDGTPLVNPKHINNGKISIDSTKTISLRKMTELSSYVMREGDVVLGRRGEIGRCAIVTKMEDGYLCGTGSIFIRPQESLSSIFLYYLISSSPIRRVLENVAKGVTMKNLNSGNVEDLVVPIPPIEIQDRFSKMVEIVEALKGDYEQSLEELKNLYGSLNNKAFNGLLIL